jgi:DNA-directed RNA polymerase subunit alpha
MLEMSRQAEQSGGNALTGGIAYWLCGNVRQAEPLLKKAKDCVQKALAMGEVYRQLCQYDKAIEQFDKAAELWADSLLAAMEKTETWRRGGDFDKAERELKRFANYKDVSAEFHYQTGRLYDAQGRYAEATENYQTAVNLDPEHISAMFQLAYSCDLRGDEDLAMEYYRQITKISPAHVGALLNLAVLYEDRREYDKAKICVDTVLRSHPNHDKAGLFRKDIGSAQVMVIDEEREERLDRQNKILEIPLSDFELSVRSRNCLKKMNLLTLGSLLRTTEAELLSYKNFGETSLTEIKKVLDMKGLRLGMAIEEKSSEIEGVSESMGKVNQEISSKPVGDLELSVRARRALERLGVKTLFELINKTEAELLGCKNFGVTSLNEIKERLSSYGLALRTLE